MYQNEIEQIIYEFPDRAIRWLLETPDNVKGLLLTAVADLAKHIDYTHLQRLDRTFISDNFRKREADLVFTAPFIDEQETREVIIYILIENQSTVDPTMPFRILSYMLRIWESQREKFESEKIPLTKWRFYPILPVVFYTGDQKWDKPLDIKQLFDLPKSLEEFIPQHKTILFNLKATSPERLVEYDHPFEWILRLMQKEKADTDEVRDSIKIAIEHLKLMLPEERANWSKLIYFMMAFIYERREDSEHEEFLNIIKNSIDNNSQRKEVEEMGKTMSQVLQERGEAIGEARGIEKGTIETKQDTIIKLMRLKFESVPEILVKNVKSINKVDQLDAIFERAVIAKTINDVEIE
jgi:predicted transposase/invertase (TIGR01784 family)